MTEIFKDPYVTLNVSRDADDQQIKRAYRALAKSVHPDVNSDQAAQERFAEVSLAYDMIKSAERRAQTASKLRGVGGRGPSSSSFDGMFSDETAEPTAGAPENRLAVRVTFREAFNGTTKTETVEVSESCPDCGGSGAAPGHQPRRCEQCRGVGAHVAGRLRTTCAACDGRGFTVDVPCPHCDGGVVHRRRQITVTVPPGVQDGEEIRVAGNGSGVMAATVLAVVTVEPSAVFHRTPNAAADLSIDVPISFSEAALGAEIKIPTPDRPVQIRIQPGTSSGKILRVQGRGMPHPGRPDTRGDLYCRIQIDVPKQMTHQQSRYVKQLAAFESRADLRSALFKEG